jgi:flagellar hook-length control protein FliK
VDVPEVRSDHITIDLPLEADLSASDIGLPLMAGPAQTATDRRPKTIADQHLAPSLTAEARSPAETQSRLQLPEQPAGDSAFARVLTEVSVATAAIIQAQPTQHNSVPTQVQIQTPLDMSQSDWAEKLVEEVSLQSMGRGDTLTLTLTPERLGPMQVRLEMQDGQTHVHFITETPEAARLLTEAQSRLADMMSRAGIDFGAHSASTGQGAQQNNRSAQGALLQDGASAPQDTPADQSEVPTRSAGLASRSNIDLVA